ncbi:hypothetical protein [Litorihabitans aurantiacus]|uniref:Uncharacterized protein n=1 Tax=Litorihabitans aurantiacus TaxID=1930061 RepID=A0AA37XGA5_9MICO|nr:hypothetical protein [Litorihabitans aurantiacus]GMA32745.1 hypothetical protein GCM10025875_27370 [Litorihabitans aurantiacus]
MLEPAGSTGRPPGCIAGSVDPDVVPEDDPAPEPDVGGAGVADGSGNPVRPPLKS